MKLLRRGGWLTDLEDLSERGQMVVTWCTVLRQQCSISALQKRVPLPVFGFSLETDNTNSSATHFTKHCVKISVYKVSYSKMSFLLLANLHKSWKRTLFYCLSVPDIYCSCIWRVIMKGEKELSLLRQEEGQINVICHMASAQEIERKRWGKKGQMWFVVSEKTRLKQIYWYCSAHRWAVTLKNLFSEANLEVLLSWAFLEPGGTLPLSCPNYLVNQLLIFFWVWSWNVTLQYDIAIYF